jgi:AcrR family transcriptional regulator
MHEKPFPRAADTTNERRDHIAEAATQVVVLKGLAGLTVRAVAVKAGCSPGLVSHYFKNKAALIQAAHDWANETYLARVASSVGGQTGLRALEARLRELLPYDEQILDEWSVRIAFWQRGNSGAPVLADTMSTFRMIYDEILQDIRDAQDSGEIAATVSPLVTSEIVLIMVVGIATVCLIDEPLRQKKPLDRRVEMILGLLKTGNIAAMQVGDPEVDY